MISSIKGRIQADLLFYDDRFLGRVPVNVSLNLAAASSEPYNAH